MMDFDIASAASAIDDTYHQIAQPPASRGFSSYGSSFGAFITGPRSGHWTVSTGNNGSGIDDRTPTLHGVAAPSEIGSVARVNKVDATTLRKLAAATEAERKAKQEALQQQAPAQGIGADVQSRTGAMSEKVKGFYVPRLQDSRGIRIRSREGKDEIVKDPVLKPTAAAKTDQSKPGAKKPAVETARPPSPSKSVKSVVPASNVTLRTTNRIRIVGKNGEETFVELPFFSRGSKSDMALQSQSIAPVAAAKSEPAIVSAPKPEAVSKNTNKQNAAAEKEAKRLRDEQLTADAKQIRDEQLTAKAKKLREERVAAELKRAAEEKAAAEAKRLRDEKAAAIARRLEAERLAAEPMMHGALQSASRAASGAASAKGSKSSSKVSEKLYPGVFDAVSKPASVASSTTSVSKGRSTQQQHVQAFGGNSSASGVRSRPSKGAGWQEVGVGTYEPAASKNGGSPQVRPSSQAGPKIASPNALSQRNGGRNGTPAAQTPIRNSPASPRGILKPPQRTPSHAHWQGDNASSHSPRHPSRHNSAKSRSHPSAATPDSFPVAFPPASRNSPSHSHQHHHQVSRQGFSYRPQPKAKDASVKEGPTIFAGRGWISPHPLSEAPTWAREEPDPLIQLPSGAAVRTESGVRTMTYEEWLAVQNQTGTDSFAAAGSRVQTVRSSARARSERRSQGSGGDGQDGKFSGRGDQLNTGPGPGGGGGRRNISRSTSHASHRQYGAGSWGHRGGGVGTAVAVAGGRNGGEGGRRVGTAMSGTYRAPTVRTESEEGVWQRQGSGRSGTGSAGMGIRGGGSGVVAEEFVGEDGNVKERLRMPWDGMGQVDGAASVGTRSAGSRSVRSGTVSSGSGSQSQSVASSGRNFF